VPHVVLVDTLGVIVYKGYPEKRNLEQDIDALLKGEKITGPWTERAAAKLVRDKAGVSRTGEALSSAAKDMFLKQAEEFREANVDALLGLQKACFVLVDDSSLDIKTGAFSHWLTCETILVGAAANVELVRNAAQVAKKGPWTTSPEEITNLEKQAHCGAGPGLKKLYPHIKGRYGKETMESEFYCSMCSVGHIHIALLY
jgi:hypothetical protein